MRKYHPALIKSVENNLPTRLTRMERAIAGENARDRLPDALEDMTGDLGEMSSGSDSIGDELVVNGDFATGDSTGWTGSTNVENWTNYASRATAGIMTLVSDRMIVDEFSFYYVQFEANFSELITEAIVQWYNDPAGGSLIIADRIPVFDYCGSSFCYNRVIHAPAGALSMCFSVSGAPVDMGASGVIPIQLDNFSAKEVSFATRLVLEPVPTLTIDSNPRRITAGARAFYSPGTTGAPIATQIVTPTGNLTNGRYYYRISYLDEYGETIAGGADVVQVDASHRQILVTLPAIPYGVTGIRIYRTASGGASYGLLTTLGASATNYTDNIADASLGAAPPEENTTLTRPVLPTFVSRLINTMRSNVVPSRSQDNAQLHNEYWALSGTDGDWLEFDVLLEAGVYLVSACGVRNTNRGKADWYVDGQLVHGAQDWRHTSLSYNYTPTFSMTIAEPGWHVIRMQVNGTSGAGYGMVLTEVWMQRTGR